jgi:hypothetical protein
MTDVFVRDINDFVRRIVAQLYHELRQKAEDLAREPDEGEKRAQFLNYFKRARALLGRAHVLTTWLGRNLPFVRAIEVCIECYVEVQN